MHKSAGTSSHSEGLELGCSSRHVTPLVCPFCYDEIGDELKGLLQHFGDAHVDSLDRVVKCPLCRRSTKDIVAHLLQHSTFSEEEACFTESVSCGLTHMGQGGSHARVNNRPPGQQLDPPSHAVLRAAAGPSATATAAAPNQGLGCSPPETQLSQRTADRPHSKFPQGDQDRTAPGGSYPAEGTALGLRDILSDSGSRDRYGSCRYQSDPPQRETRGSTRWGGNKSDQGESPGMLGGTLDVRDGAAAGPMLCSDNMSWPVGNASGWMSEDESAFGKPARLKGGGNEKAGLRGCTSAGSMKKAREGESDGGALLVEAPNTIPPSPQPHISTAAVHGMTQAQSGPQIPAIAPASPASSTKAGSKSAAVEQSKTPLLSTLGPKESLSPAGLVGEGEPGKAAVSDKLRGDAAKRALAQDSLQMRSEFVRDLLMSAFEL